MPNVSMTPQRPPFVIIVLAVLAVATALSACGDGDDGSSFRPGQLTDPRTVPTATPWAEPPEIIILDPDALTPISGGSPSTPEGRSENGGDEPAGGEPGVCGETYTVVAGDTMLGIAEKCGVDPQDLIAANPDVDPASLSIGQVLRMPRSSGGEDEGGE
jgi:hypothetical protein